jgi:glycosyltransferase involved in cell wall biosynthesis
MALDQTQRESVPSPFPASAFGYRPADPSEPPAVSIITAYYNTGPLFFETVTAVLRQSLQQWEWIIVNDGSSDPQAVQTLLALRNADQRIRVIDSPNRGPSAARNLGVAQSRAPLLFLLDSDDLIGPTCLEKLAWTLHSHPESAFASTWTTVFGQVNIRWPRGFDTRYAFPYENMACTQSMIRRSVFDALGGFDEERRAGLEDFEFWMRAAAQGYWGHDLHEYLIWSRRKAPEHYTSYRWDFNDGPQAEQALRRELKQRYPHLFRDGVPRPRSAASGLLDTYSLVPRELPFANRLQTRPDKRRILVLLPWITVGGADRFALDLIAGLQAQGDRISVCLLRDVEHTWMNELQAISEDVFNLAAFLTPANYARFLHYLIESRQIETVLISNSLLAYQLLPYLRSCAPEVRFIDYLHMEDGPWRAGGYPRAAIDNDGLFDLHITSSAYVRNWMIERGAEPERIEVAYIGTDTDTWRPNSELRATVRSELGIDETTPVILFAGRLAPEKRPELVLELLNDVSKAGRHFVALIAGDGEYRRDLERLIKRYRLDNQVRLLGAVSHQRVHDLLAASDCLLLPSSQEGVALVVYEALAMGVVPIAADVGGQAELVQADCGILVPPGPNERQAYLEALLRVLDDSELRQAMARAGRLRCESLFSTTAMIERMSTLFDLAHQRPARAPVSAAVGYASLSLVSEHYQLETRLRGLAPVRLLLRLRKSALWHSLSSSLSFVRRSQDRVDRKLYVLRREVMQALRRVIKR